MESHDMVSAAEANLSLIPLSSILALSCTYRIILAPAIQED